MRDRTQQQGKTLGKTLGKIYEDVVRKRGKAVGEGGPIKRLDRGAPASS